MHTTCLGVQEASKYIYLSLEFWSWPFELYLKKKVNFMFAAKLVQIGPKTNVTRQAWRIFGEISSIILRWLYACWFYSIAPKNAPGTQ